MPTDVPKSLEELVAEKLRERVLIMKDVQKARESFPYFVERVGRDEKDNPLAMDSADLKIVTSCLHECYEQKHHIAIITPPGRGKSTLASLFFLWRIGHEQTLRTVVISGDETAATDRVAACRKTLLTHAYRQTFPEVRPDYEQSRVKGATRNARDEQGWRRDGWFLKAVGQRKDPTMAAIAAVPKREDIRVDMLLADDIITEQIAASAAMRGAVHNAFWNTWIEGRLSNGGWCCYLQNVRSKQDLAHLLRHDRRFCSLWIGVNDDDTGMFVRLWNPPPRLSIVERPEDFQAEASPLPEQKGVLTPDHEYAIPLPRHAEWTTEKLALKNPAAKRKLLRLRADEPGDIMFPDWRTRKGEPRRAHELLGLSLSNDLPFATSEALTRLTFTGGLDLASLKRKGTVLWVIAQDGQRRIYPVELHIGKFTDLGLVDLIDSIWKRGIRFRSLKIENNALQDRVQRTIEGEAQRRSLEWWGRLSPFHTGANKMHPEHGLPGINTMLHNGQIIWPDAESTCGAPHSSDWLAFEQAMADLPKVIERGNTPDEIMAFWFALEEALNSPPGGDPGGHTEGASGLYGAIEDDDYRESY